MEIENENFLFETENFIVILDANSVYKLHVLIFPKSDFKFFAELSTELLHEFEIITKILTTMLEIDNFILFEQTEDNSKACMHFVGNVFLSEQKFTDKINNLIKLNENKNLSDFIRTKDECLFYPYQGSYLFYYFDNKVFFLPKNFIASKVPGQVFRFVIDNEQKSKLIFDVKKRFENKVLIYSLLELWIGRRKKLVRDNIPEIFAGKNKKIKFTEVGDDKYIFFLKRKLVEEVNEVLDALENSDEDHQQEEIGDVLEVIDAIKSFRNFTNDEVLKKKEDKKKDKGGFYKKMILFED